MQNRIKFIGLFFMIGTAVLGQRIFNDGTITFQDGTTIEAEIRQDSYSEYAKGIGYRMPGSKDLIEAGPERIRSFTIGGDQQFYAYSVTTRIETGSLAYYARRKRFLRQLESGMLNLYEQIGEPNWLYVQRGDDGPLERLYALDVRFATANSAKSPLRVDTVSQTVKLKTSSSGYVDMQRYYLEMIQRKLRDSNRVPLPDDLELQASPIRRYIAKYNTQPGATDYPISFFQKELRLRTSVLARYSPVDNYRDIYLTAYGLELEVLFNSFRNNFSISLAYSDGGRYEQTRTIRDSNGQREVTTETKIDWIGFRFNYYITLRNRLQPYLFAGLLSSPSVPSPQRPSFDPAGGSTPLNMGLGLLYDALGDGSLIFKLDVGSRKLPDTRFGLGVTF